MFLMVWSKNAAIVNSTADVNSMKEDGIFISF